MSQDLTISQNFTSNLPLIVAEPLLEEQNKSEVELHDSNNQEVMANRINSACKEYLIRKRLREQKLKPKTQQNAQIILQSDEQALSTKRAVLKIQRWFCFQRTKLRTIKYGECSRVVQLMIERYYWMQLSAKRRMAVVKLQRFGRLIKINRVARQEQIIQNTVDELFKSMWNRMYLDRISKVQSLWRGKQVRRLLGSDIERFKEEAQQKLLTKRTIRLQRAWHRFNWDQSQMKLKRATQLIQGYVRMKHLSYQFQRLKYASMVIQRWYRARVQRLTEQQQFINQYFTPLEQELNHQRQNEAHALWNIGCEYSLTSHASTAQSTTPEDDPQMFSLLDRCLHLYRPRLQKMCLFMYPIDIDIHCDIETSYNPHYSYARTLLNLLIQQIGRDHPIQTIHVTEQSTLCVTIGGSSIYEFGTNMFFSPNQDDGQVQKVLLPEHIKVKSLSSNDTHILIATADGTLLQYGEPASTTYNKQYLPYIHSMHVSTCCTSSYFSYAVCNQYKAYAWDGRPGKALNVPNPVKSCCAGNNFAALLCANGTLYTWGENIEGELGHGDSNARLDPCLVSHIQHERITQVSCGLKHMSAKSSLNRLYTWGWGERGQLGHGGTQNESLPKLLLLAQGRQVLWGVCGRTQTLVIDDNFQVQWCGTNSLITSQSELQPFQAETRSQIINNLNNKYVPVRVLSTYSRTIEVTYITYANTFNWLDGKNNKKNKILMNLIKIWSESNNWSSTDPPFNTSVSNHIYEASMRKTTPQYNRAAVSNYFYRQQFNYREENTRTWSSRKVELVEYQSLSDSKMEETEAIVHKHPMDDDLPSHISEVASFQSDEIQTREDKLIWIKRRLIELQQMPVDQLSEQDIEFIQSIYESKVSQMLQTLQV